MLGHEGLSQEPISSIPITGAASPDVTLALVGQAVTASAGTLTPSTSIALSGQSVTASAGTLTPTVSLALAGQAVTSAAGTLAPSASIALAGQSVAAASGVLTPSVALSLNGQAVTASAGTITADIVAGGGDVTLALTGVTVTVSAGTLTAVTHSGAVGCTWTASSVDILSSGTNWAASGWMECPPTGGFLIEFELYQTRRRRRLEELEKLEREALEEVQSDQVMADIAALLHKQQQADAEREELQRLKELVARSMADQNASDAVAEALRAAQKRGTTAALDRLQRLARDQIEEEEFLLQAALLVLH